MYATNKLKSHDGTSFLFWNNYLYFLLQFRILLQGKLQNEICSIFFYIEKHFGDDIQIVKKIYKIVRNKSNEMKIYFSDSIIDFYVNTFIYSLILLYVVFVNRWISWYMQIPAYVSFIVKAQMPKINLLHIDITYVWYKTEFSLNLLKCNILYNIMF